MTFGKTLSTPDTIFIKNVIKYEYIYRCLTSINIQYIHTYLELQRGIEHILNYHTIHSEIHSYINQNIRGNPNNTF